MAIPLEIIAKVFSPLIAALIGAVTKHYLEARPRLVTYVVWASAIPVPGEQDIQVNTHTIVVRNTGKKTANNVRIGHYYLPTSYQIFPPVSYQVVNGPSGAAEILVPTLVPNEQVSISYLYLPPYTFEQINSYAKSDECLAKVIRVIPSPQVHKAIVILFGLLAFVGASTFIYWLFFVVAGWLTL